MRKGDPLPGGYAVIWPTGAAQGVIVQIRRVSFAGLRVSGEVESLVTWRMIRWVDDLAGCQAFLEEELNDA